MNTKTGVSSDGYPWYACYTEDGHPFIEWYRDDADNSGFGDNPEITRWYGSTFAECLEYAKNNPAPKNWHDLMPENTMDFATRTGMYDG